MKYIKNINELFGLNKSKDDDIAQRILDIVEKENITIFKSDDYIIYIDKYLYKFAKFDSEYILKKYDKSQEKKSYSFGYIGRSMLGEPLSKYIISKKIWKNLEKLYKKQQINKLRIG